LSRGLAAVDLEARKERRRHHAKRTSFDEDVPMAAPDAPKGESSGEGEGVKPGDEAEKPKTPPKPEEPESTPRDQLKSAAKRVKDRHVALRVKNLVFLSSLNDEAMRAQAKLRAIMERSDGALLPEVSVTQKTRVFELVAQLLEASFAECQRGMANPASHPSRVLEKSFGFVTALEFCKDVAMPTDSRTQALKLAGMVDLELICLLLDGPFRRRLLSAGLAKRRELPAGTGMRSRSSGCGLPGSLGPAAPSALSSAATKAWEDATNACCNRMVQVVRLAMKPPPAREEGSPVDEAASSS